MGANGASAIVLDRVSKSFDGVRAVRALSAQVPRGTIYGFLGPNGAGKTTTIRMIMDILRPDGGRIEVLGAASARQAKDRVGYMPEERGLYPRMKVRNILAFFAALKGVPKTKIPGRIEGWLKAMDLSGWQHKEVRALSRGMQRRLEFVVAVIGNPELIVMDEPFAGLDPVNLDLVKDTILRMRAAGKTIILSTHIMEQAETLCDRILLINRGEKVLDGSLGEIRAPYGSDAVVVELDGDSRFIESLPMVRGVTRSERKITVELREKGRDQELLAALVGRVRVRAFEIKTPSLHEIFVRVVRGRHE
ncbi:MAG: ATP-binding cassette domain-containing protein [Candidatus Brocadiia bacterium]